MEEGMDVEGHAEGLTIHTHSLQNWKLIGLDQSLNLNQKPPTHPTQGILGDAIQKNVIFWEQFPYLPHPSWN